MTVNITSGKSTRMLPPTVDMVVDLLKSIPSIATLTNPDSRISSTLPTDDDKIVYPWLTVSRVVGVPVLPEAGIDRARMTFNAWGGVTTSGAPYWPDADLLIRTVEHELRSMLSAEIGTKGFIMSVSGLEGIQQLVDPDDNGARFWMDAIVVARGA